MKKEEDERLHRIQLKYSKLEASVSQTMGRGAQQAAKRLRMYRRNYEKKGGFSP